MTEMLGTFEQVYMDIAVTASEIKEGVRRVEGDIKEGKKDVAKGANRIKVYDYFFDYLI